MCLNRIFNIIKNYKCVIFANSFGCEVEPKVLIIATIFVYYPNI